MDVRSNLTSLVQFGIGITTIVTTMRLIKGEKWWPNLELNQGHADFQSAALPTELFGHYLEMTILLNQSGSKDAYLIG